jgi:hypothetical protein
VPKSKDLRQCSHCSEPLREARWSPSKKFKSCPECSGADAKSQHIFLAYPEAFDVTDARASSVHPDGPQSWCAFHRGRAPERGFPIRCSDVAARDARSAGQR